MYTHHPQLAHCCDRCGAMVPREGKAARALASPPVADLGAAPAAAASAGGRAAPAQTGTAGGGDGCGCSGASNGKKHKCIVFCEHLGCDGSCGRPGVSVMGPVRHYYGGPV